MTAVGQLQQFFYLQITDRIRKARRPKGRRATECNQLSCTLSINSSAIELQRFNSNNFFHEG